MATAGEVQSTAISFANTNAAMMDSFASKAESFAFEQVDWFASWNTPNYVFGYNGGVTQTPNNITLPGITGTLPKTPTLNAVTVPAFGNAPEFLTGEPVIKMPTAPSDDLPSAPGDAPTFVSPVLPDVPSLVLPDAPSFQNVVVPDMPLVEYPVFSSELPVDDIIAPTDVFSYIEPVYESALLDALKAKLMYDIVNGGYGIDDADEQRLWQRAREREAVNGEAAIQDATRQIAARGFSVPPGVLNTVLAQAMQTAVEKNSSLSRDILIKKADLYVQNRQFTIQQVREVEQMLITQFGYMAERLLKSAKDIVELGIAVFNARVAKYNYSLERYKAAASVYSELIKGVSLKLEAYKTQVEGAKLSVDVQRVHAEVYKIQIDGANALMNLYATQVSAAKTVSEIERLKLDAFRTVVDTYTAQVGAKVAEFGMFESQIKGEMAKVNVYQAEAQAYGTKVAAYKTKVDAAEVTARTQVQVNQLLLDQYRSDIQRYSTEVQASQVALSSAVQKYDADIKKFSVIVDANIRASQQNVEAGKANAEIAVSHASVIANTTIHGAALLSAKAAAAANTMASVAGAYGSASAAAMSAATGLEARVTTA